MKKFHSESASSIYIPIKPETQSDEYIITKLHIDNLIYFPNVLWKIKVFNEISKFTKDINCECHTDFMGRGNKFVMNGYNIFDVLPCYIHLLSHYYLFVVSNK